MERRTEHRGEAGDRVQRPRLRGEAGSQGADGELTDAATAMEIMGDILVGKTLDSRGIAGDASSGSSESSGKAFVEAGVLNW